MARIKGYLVTAQHRMLAAELARRSLLLAALQASLRREAEQRLRFGVVRNHLRLHHSASYADVPDSEIRRACQQLRISCTRAFVVGVELRAPRWKRAQSSWAGRLEGEGLSEEPPLITRAWSGDVPLEPETLPQPGQLYNGADGVRRQVPDGLSFAVVADTKNPDGTRGRPRRWMRYLGDLRAYLARARIPARDREILELTVAGLSSIRLGRQLGLSASLIRKVVGRHNRIAGIKGPGPGR